MELPEPGDWDQSPDKPTHILSCIAIKSAPSLWPEKLESLNVYFKFNDLK